MMDDPEARSGRMRVTVVWKTGFFDLRIIRI